MNKPMTGFQPQRVGWYNKQCKLFRVDTVPIDMSVEVYVANIRKTDPAIRDCDYIIIEE